MGIHQESPFSRLCASSVAAWVCAPQEEAVAALRSDVGVERGAARTLPRLPAELCRLVWDMCFQSSRVAVHRGCLGAPCSGDRARPHDPKKGAPVRNARRVRRHLSRSQLRARAVAPDVPAVLPRRQSDRRRRAPRVRRARRVAARGRRSDAVLHVGCSALAGTA